MHSNYLVLINLPTFTGATRKVAEVGFPPGLGCFLLFIFLVFSDSVSKCENSEK